MVPKVMAFPHILLGIAIGGALGLIGSPFPSDAKELTLQDLLDGSAIVIGDKEFGGFGKFESEATGGADPVEPARVVVLPKLDASGPGLRFVGNFFGERSVFHADVGQAQTTSFQYEVRTLAGEDLIVDDTLELGRFVLLDLVGGRPIQITETVRDERDQLLGEKSVFVSTFAQVLTDGVAFAPQDRLVITKKIGLTGGTLDEFRQDFSQVPAPSTLSLFATSTVALLGYAWRRRKRCVSREEVYYIYHVPFAHIHGLSGGTLDEFRQGFSQVPAPSALSLFATSTVGLLGYAWRRRKRCVSRGRKYIFSPTSPCHVTFSLPRPLATSTGLLDGFTGKITLMRSQTPNRVAEA